MTESLAKPSATTLVAVVAFCGFVAVGFANASNMVLARANAGETPAFSLAFFRWSIVALGLAPFAFREIRLKWAAVRARYRMVVAAGACGMFLMGGPIYMAGVTTTAINIGILQGALPIFVMVGAFLAHGTRVTLMQVVGVLITSIGVLVIATRGVPLGILDIEFNRGDLLMLIACVLYAFYAVALRKRPAIPGAPFFTLLALIAALTSLPLLAFEALTTGLTMPTSQGLMVTAFVAIFPSCLAQLYFMRGVDLIGPGRAGIFMNLVPVFSAILAVVLLGEPFMMFHLVALVLVISGILLAQLSSGAG
jgi:drug/metabolite transporter (DMT)-like permease